MSPQGPTFLVPQDPGGKSPRWGPCRASERKGKEMGETFYNGDDIEKSRHPIETMHPEFCRLLFPVICIYENTNCITNCPLLKSS